MPIFDGLDSTFGDRLPIMLQTEATECGLACLAMIASYHGHHCDLSSMRRSHPVSLKGVTLANIVSLARKLNFGTRAVKVELESLGQVRLPCVLHWNFNHFVVLKKVTARSLTIHDPSFGARTLSIQQASKCFTGVALELWPTESFLPREKAPAIPLRKLMGKITGIRRSISQILVLALVLEMFALINPFFMQWVVDDVVVSLDHNLLGTLAIGFGVLVLLQQLVSAVRSWAIMYMGTTLNIQWRANVLTHLISLPIQYFEKRQLGDVISRFGSVDLIQRTLTTSFMEVVLDGLMSIVTVIMMLVYSSRLTAIVLAAMGLYVAFRWFWYRPLSEATAEQIVHAAKQQTHLMETVRGIKTIKLYQRQDERRSHWLNLLVLQINADLRTQKLSILFKLINGMLFGIENILIVWIGARLIIHGDFSAGVLIAFVAYKAQFENRISSLIEKSYEMKMLQLQGERLADIVFTKPEDLGEEGRVHEIQEAAVPDIKIIDLQFRYSDNEPLILSGLNLSIDAGESVAIVGASGCGKTTLLNVLLGILQPTSGDILIDGISVRKTGIGALRSIVGTVLQDDVLFAGSLAENICFFDQNPDYAWIEECAKMAAIADEIAAMPMGYNTLIGDMGTVLSGGQKQRILFARALYKKPSILFLDEATSHLDVAKEFEVNAAIKALNITRIIVAHRPETIAMAGRVVVMREGKIVEEKKTEGSIVKIA